jgi:hypothetical protein
LNALCWGRGVDINPEKPLLPLR